LIVALDMASTLGIAGAATNAIRAWLKRN